MNYTQYIQLVFCFYMFYISIFFILSFSFKALCTIWILEKLGHCWKQKNNIMPFHAFSNKVFYCVYWQKFYGLCPCSNILLDNQVLNLTPSLFVQPDYGSATMTLFTCGVLYPVVCLSVLQFSSLFLVSVPTCLKRVHKNKHTGQTLIILSWD